MANPYRAPVSSRVIKGSSNESARLIVIGVAIFMVMQSVILMGLQLLVFGDVPGITQFIRLALTVLLAFFLFAGSNVARYLTMFFYGLAAVMSAMALPALYERQGVVLFVVFGILALANASVPVLLKAPPGMDEHFA